MERLPYLLTVALTILGLMLFNTISQAQTSFNVSNKTTGDTLLTIDNAGRVGLGTTIPGAGLHMVNDYGAVFSGTFGVGSIPVEGAGVRLMWYPAKAAFRVGQVNLDQWDDANIGDYSIAMGRRTTASGAYAQTYGNFSIASGLHSMAFGRGAIASGVNAISIGRSIEAAGDFSIAIGVGEQAGTVVNQDTTLVIYGGRVGIHTLAPTSAFEVADTVYSSFGGFKFPDGTVQETAAGSGTSNGNTLGQDYDQGGAGAGRTITADNGAVNIQGSDGLTVNGNLGIGDATPTNKLDVAGKIGISDTQVVYLPDQTSFEGSLFIGTGGNNLFNPTLDEYGRYNTALGLGALQNNSYGYKNTATGYQSLFSNLGDINSDEAAENTAIGYQSLFFNNYGSRNTALGYQALFYPTHLDENTAVGYMAGYGDGYTGNHDAGNTYVGAYTGRNIDGGSYNTIVGFRAGEGPNSSPTSFSGNVFIGAYAGRFVTNESNRLIIDNQWEFYDPLIYGEFDTRKLRINGRFESTDTIYASGGGFKFPDGTTQTTAASSGEDKWSGTTDIYYNDGNVGIGTSTPLTKLHVKDIDLSLTGASLANELITVEDLDAGLGLYSNNDGNYGSVFSLGEIVSGALNNKWSLYRTTSVANPANQLRFSFGSNVNYNQNPAWITISSNGNVGIGGLFNPKLNWKLKSTGQMVFILMVTTMVMRDYLSRMEGEPIIFLMMMMTAML